MQSASTLPAASPSIGPVPSTAVKTAAETRLLLFRPGAMLHVDTRAESKLLVANTLFLLQAMESGRRGLVWPQIDCASNWIQKNREARHGVDEIRVYAHGTSNQDRACYDVGTMSNACASRGVLSLHSRKAQLFLPCACDALSGCAVRCTVGLGLAMLSEQQDALQLHLSFSF